MQLKTKTNNVNGHLNFYVKLRRLKCERKQNHVFIKKQLSFAIHFNIFQAKTRCLNVTVKYQTHNLIIISVSQKNNQNIHS